MNTRRTTTIDMRVCVPFAAIHHNLIEHLPHTLVLPVSLTVPVSLYVLELFEAPPSARHETPCTAVAT